MNYFFDTSALVKIYHEEEGADKVLEIYNSERQITISELANAVTCPAPKAPKFFQTRYSTSVNNLEGNGYPNVLQGKKEGGVKNSAGKGSAKVFIFYPRNDIKKDVVR